MCDRIQTIAIVAVAVLLRWCVTYHPYSGQKKSLMYGDYEAQRHWQEITFNLPVERWYTNSTDNDLQYWGLDYPPLTAYHSLLLAHVANKINPDYVKLHKSRGYESESHKYFMRLSVLFTDLLIYIPAVLWFISKLMVQKLGMVQVDEWNIFGLKKENFVLATALIYPGLILIDHGHFQYNCASLGFFVIAVTAVLENRLVIGSFFFVLALNYKQMELYHALPFFFYILGSNTPGRGKKLMSCVCTLTCVVLTVILTFGTTWSPFLLNRSTFFNVTLRLFPFARGVFEDKVANVWCAINVVHKLRKTFTNLHLAQICLTTTMVAVLPCCMDLYFRPLKRKFVISLINSSLAFFLFSFQVHEKSILLVSIPVLMHFHEDPLPCFWFLLTSTFSMLPLFIKDDLFLAFIATTIFYIISVYWMFPHIFYVSIFVDKVSRQTELSKDNIIFRLKKYLSKYRRSERSLKVKSKHYDALVTKFDSDTIQSDSFKSETECHPCTVNVQSMTLINGWHFTVIRLFYLSLLGMLLLTLNSIFLKPPERYPDLFPLLVSVYSCGHFLIFFLYFNYKQMGTLKKYSREEIKLD